MVSTIDGLKLTLTGGELSDLLARRVEAHRERARWWQREQTRTPAEQTDDEPLLPNEMCENEEAKHRWRADVLTFLREHLEVDEGFLGSGAALRAGAGVRLTSRLTLQAVVDRIPYYRDVEYLTFDGRVIFSGAEVSSQSARPRVRPFVTVGVGIMNDRRAWIHKRTSFADPRVRIEERTDHDFTLSVLTASGGLDIRATDHASIRVGARLHGLLDTGDDLAPHVIVQPFVGVAYRW